MSAADWLNESGADFVARHTGRPKSPPQTATPQQEPPKPLTVGPMGLDRISNTKGQNDTMSDNTERKLILQTLMQSDTNQFITLGGKRQTVGEHLKEMLKGTESAPISPAQPTPQQTGAPSITPSQAAIDGLSEQHYQQLTETGGIDGVTRPSKPTVSIREGGAVEIRQSFNPDTGKVEEGRPLDMSLAERPVGHRAWWEHE
jgi:hypothetical protein